MKTFTPEQISNHIWEILQSMAESPNEQIHLQNETETLSLSFIEFESIPIPEDKAKELILNKVTEILKAKESVVLYYCPDNALISISDSQQAEREGWDKEYSAKVATNYYEDKD